MRTRDMLRTTPSTAYIWSELFWAIELCVMHARWCETTEAPTQLRATRKLQYAYDERLKWLRMCLRLGDHASYQIIHSRKEIWP